MIRFSNVTKVYPNGTEALRGLSFELGDGEFAFLVGPSGAGKSTILNLVTAEEPITEGTLMVNGYNLNTIRPRQVPYLRRSLGVVFQDFRLIEKKTVYENLAFAMRVIGASSREMHNRIPYVLELVGLEDKQKRHPSELSGGEQQRVAIARALVNNPTTIIADEPTGNLDPDRSMEIMSLLEAINSLGATMLVVTHEKGLVNHFSKRVIHIEDGRIVGDEQQGSYVYAEEKSEPDSPAEPFVGVSPPVRSISREEPPDAAPPAARSDRAAEPEDAAESVSSGEAADTGGSSGEPISVPPADQSGDSVFPDILIPPEEKDRPIDGSDSDFDLDIEEMLADIFSFADEELSFDDAEQTPLPEEKDDVYGNEEEKKTQ